MLERRAYGKNIRIMTGRMRDVDGKSTEISYEEYCDVKNVLLNQADFVRNICSNKIE